MATVKALAALIGIALLVSVLTAVDLIASLFEKRPTDEDRKRAAGRNPYHTPFS